MPDDNDQNATTTTDPSTPKAGQAPAATSGERMFSQSEVDRIVQERLARATRQGGKQTTKVADEADDEKLTLRQLKSQLDEFRLDQEFDRLAIGERLSSEQAAVLRPLFRMARASGGEGWNGSSWLRDVRSALGATKQETVNPQTPSDKRPTGAQSRPVSDDGGTAAPSRVTSDTPLRQLSPEDRNALIKQKGLVWYRRTMQEQARGLRIQVRR